MDIGTKNVRCVVGHVDQATGAIKIVGVGQSTNSGMRKGVVSHLTGPAAAIDKALEEAERMSGHQIDAAVLSINGSHIISTKTDGMVAVGAGGEVSAEDIARVEEVATTGKVPANREVLEIVPHAYRLDGQDGIKDPIGMTGTRLEISANVISGLTPHLVNIQKSAEMASVESLQLVPSVLASARAVLNESQIENGVAVLDIGGATTSLAIFEEGDLQHVSVLPVGAQSVTNDLAIGLKTDPEIAEQVKLSHARFGGKDLGNVETKVDKQTHKFKQSDIDEIVEARYEEIFELVAKELKKAGGIGRLPSGVVLVGGGSKVKGLVEFAKQQLGVAAKVGQPNGFTGMTEEVKGPEFSAVIGLVMADAIGEYSDNQPEKSKSSGGAFKKAGGFLSGLLAKFK
ncbi:cell division protein FtsA [Candidatus Saccharibacteria bacterium]|nr:MAG: cell division protein FtsA [Candidatus Saccharibacteria bacterium]